MNAAKAKQIKYSVYEYCKTIAHPNPKMVYRRVKKAYLATPDNLKHKFDVRTGTVK